MAWVTPAHVFAHIRIGRIPERRDVSRGLHRATSRRQERHAQGLACHDGVHGGAEHLLQAQFYFGRAIFIIYRNAPPQRRFNMRRCSCIKALLLIPCEKGF